MSRYRKTMSEAMAEVELNEVGYLQSKLNDKQIQNIKKIWQFKTKADVTPAVKKMIANMDVPTQLAIKDAGIKHISDLIEGRMSDIDAMRKQGASAAKIAKELGLDVKAVKAILGEQDSAQDMQDVKKQEKIKEDKELEEINNMISELGYGQKLQKVYVKRDGSDFNVFYRGRTKWGTNKQIGYFHRIPGGKLSVYHDNKNDEDDFTQNDMGFSVQKAIGIIFDTADDNGVIKEDKELDQEFLDDVASNTPNEEQFDEEDKKEEEKKKKTDVAPEHDSNTGEEKSENSKEKLEKEVEKKDQEIASLKQKAETDKAKAIKKDTEKMVNPETGEPLLQIGLAYKHMRDKMKKEMQKEEVISEAGISPAMIATLKREYEPFRGKRISAARAQQLMNILNKFKDSDLQKLSKENIPFISTGAKSKLVVRGMKFTVKDIKPFGEDLDEEMFEACWTGYKQVGMKNKGGKQVPNCVPEETILNRVNEMAKDKAYAIGMSVAKKKYNDEPPLDKKTITKGHEIADKLLKKEEKCPKCGKSNCINASNCSYEEVKEFKKMKVTIQDMDKRKKAIADLMKQNLGVSVNGGVIKVDGKGKDLNNYAKDLMNFYGANVKAENAPSVADIDRLKKQGMKPKMKNEDHPAKEVYESIAAVRKKAEKSGMPYGVLKKVYDRGMAAWRGGHRPGATQVQWALARVNSFVTKSSGTWGGADKDLAKQVRGK